MTQSPAAFWWRHARVPFLGFLLAITLIATLGTDERLARAFFFDPVHRHWIGADSWWTNEFLHTGGRWLMRGIAAVALALWFVSWADDSLRALRRPAACFVISMTLSVAAIGLLKTVTNVDCPWDLVEFGGRYPYVSLFADRPDVLRHGRCFPAAHASSGYALFALYFAVRERSRRWAKLGIALAALVGATFGLAQQSRGAHFVSHDVWSAFLVWMISLTIYACVFRARLWTVAVEPASSAASARRLPRILPTGLADAAVLPVRIDVAHGAGRSSGSQGQRRSG